MQNFFDALWRELFGESAAPQPPGAEDAAARELRELAAALRLIRGMLERGEVDATTFASVERAIEARRSRLRADGRKPPEPAATVPPRTPLELMESLLQGSDDPRALPPSRRQAALECWRRLSSEEVAALSSPTLLALARLLRIAGMTSRSLELYRRLLDLPTLHRRADVAVEAGNFAGREGKVEEACRFLEAALGADPTPDTRLEAEELLRWLRPPPAVEYEPIVPPPAGDLRSEPAPLPAAPDVPPDDNSRAGDARTEVSQGPPEIAPVPMIAPSAPQRSPPTSAPPRKPLTRVLAAFMEERNILWGELVGGLLIVGCSVALVITLWKTLEQLPYFPFLIFTAVTAALFGAGLYTLHHWKLTATSRGLLVITLLLTPLNLLVLADPTGGQGAGLMEFAVKPLALLLFGGLVYVAGRDLIGRGDLPAVVDRRWLLVLAVVGVSAVPLVAPHLLDPRRPLPLLLLGLAAASCHALAVGAVLGGLSRTAHRSEPASSIPVPQAYALLLFVGAATFALATALGFLLTRAEAVGEALHVLAIPFAVGGAPVLSAGLLVHRRTASSPGAETGGVRTAGTAVALAGLAAMAAAVALAWPAPAALVAVCAWGGGVMTVVAFRHGVPAAHAAALAFLALCCVVAYHLAVGELPLQAGEDGSVRLALLLCSSDSAVVLTAFALAAVAAGEALARRRRPDDAIAYMAAAGATALGAVCLATWHGFEAPGRAVLTCGLCGAAAVLVNFRWRRAALPYLGLGLCAAALLWGLWWARALGLPCDAPGVGGPANPEAAKVFGPALTWDWPGSGGTAHGVCGLILAAAALMLAAGSAALRRAGGDGALGQLGRAARDVAGAVGLFAAASVAEPTFAEAGTRAGSAAVLAAAALVLAWVYGRRLVVWVGSAFLLASLVHLLVGFVGEARLSRPLTAALLGHATLALSAGLAVRWIGRDKGRELDRLFGGSLRLSAVIASAAAAYLLLVPDGFTAVHAAYVAWLAVVWLATAWALRSPAWFTAFQAALTAAVVFGATAWLQTRSWVQTSSLGLADPRALQSYGAALAALGLAWVAARAASSVYPVARGLWPSRLSADRIVLGGLVVGQAALALWGIAPGVLDELVPARFGFVTGWPAAHVHAYGPGAWVLLGSLAAVLIAELFWRGRAAVVLGLVAVALTFPVLAAGPFSAETATASALRWGAADCFLACSALLWLRRPLGRLASAAGVHFDVGAGPAARQLLVAAAAVMILSLTLAVAALGFAGEQPAGPGATSFFARIGWTASNIVPLVLLSTGLAAFAVRERSPGYAFAAGLVADVSLMGGYALAVVTGGGALDAVQIVRVFQLGALGAALWALGWLLVRRWVLAWREAPSPDFMPAASARPLMLLQIGAALAGNALLLVPAVLLIALPAAGRWAWTVEAGSPLGWLALLAALAAPTVRSGQQRVVAQWPAVLLAGAALLGLAACTAERVLPGSGYRVLMLGVAGYGLLWALAPFLARRAAPRTAFVAVPTPEQASGVVLVIGAAVVALALQGAAVLNDPLAASAAVALVAAAAGATAYVRASDGWAFLAACCGNLAVTLLAIHFLSHAGAALWLVRLIQVNVGACAGAALLWQAANRFLPDGPAGGRLLTLQALVGIAAHTVLLLAPAGLLVLAPGAGLPAPLAAAGDPAGWLALLAAAAAALWRLGDVKPETRIHVLGAAGLSAGVLAACAAAPWDTGNWLAFHLLTLVWAFLGIGATAAGSIAFALRTGGLVPGGPLAERFAALFPARRLRRWLEGVGLAVAALALRAGGEDPFRPYSTAPVVLAVSVMAGALALWFRRARYVYASGLLFTAAGVLVWSAWGQGRVGDFALTVALGLAVAGAFWAAVEHAMRPVWRMQDERGDGAAPSPFDPPFPVPPFAHIAPALGLGVLSVVAASALAADAAGVAITTNDALCGATALALTVGLVLCQWDRRAFLAPAGLYVLGLTAAGLGLHAAGLRMADLGWWAGLMLAGYAAAAAGFVRAARRADFARLLRLPAHPLPWLLPAQAGVACASLVLSVWMCFGFDALEARLGGPAIAALLAAGAVAAVGAGQKRWDEPLRATVLLLIVLAAAEAAAAVPRPGGAAAWLNRDVLLIPTLTPLAIFFGAVVPRLPRLPPAWAAWGRRLAPAVGGLAGAALLALVTEEFRLYEPGAGRTPMGSAGAAVVACAQILLAAACVAEGIRRGRARFVYAAEAVLVLLFVHLRLNVPELFHPEAARCWMLIVVAVAFLGVGLSEFFARRGQRVLAAPLQRTGVFLPLLPLMAFWVRPPEPLMAFADLHAPGLRPFLAYLEAPAGAFDAYALVWLLVALLYACLAAVRRSPLYALLAALAANCGLWSLLTHFGVAFLVHPQAWLIPAGLILLAAEYRNRSRLRPELALGLRYFGLTLVYVSSTADLFIAGIGHSVVLPIVLALLAVAGALAGVWLRVRAFLFLGVAFLALDVFTMIWHAAVDREQTWVWWASGIVLGAAILTLFAVFEKRRNDVIRIVEDVRRWD